MNGVTRRIGLIILALGLSGHVVAEDLPLPEVDGLDFPGESLFPPEHDPPQQSGQRSVLAEPGEILSPSHGAPPLDEEPWESVAYENWTGESAMPVSSGTWLERGMWYAEAEAVVLNRIWDRVDIFLAAGDVNVTSPQFIPGFTVLNTNRTINLQGSHPGRDASVRTTLGRFLFRDELNRDHSAEFTAFGGGDWVSDQSVSSLQPNGLFTPFVISGGNRAFDGSSFQRVLYSSRYNSFELNYRVKQRLGRDQMVMDPNGRWRREASNGVKREYLIGLRYLEMREMLDWTAEDIIEVGSDGRYLINTDNNLFGVQVGGSIGYETGRWSVAAQAKNGLFINDADAHSQLDFTADDNNDFNRHATEDELSYLAEAGLLGRWHLSPSFSLRAGLQLMIIESLALAPKQINFIDDTSRIGTTGYSFYMGGSLGFEGYW